MHTNAYIYIYSYKYIHVHLHIHGYVQITIDWYIQIFIELIHKYIYQHFYIYKLHIFEAIYFHAYNKKQSYVFISSLKSVPNTSICNVIQYICMIIRYEGSLPASFLFIVTKIMDSVDNKHQWWYILAVIWYMYQITAKMYHHWCLLLILFIILIKVNRNAADKLPPCMRVDESIPASTSAFNCTPTSSCEE
jgi:hypothetical protein